MLQMKQEETQPYFKRVFRKVDIKDSTFFSDLNSPYQFAPIQVKSMFSLEGNNNVKVIKNPPKFQSKRGKTFICTKFFPAGYQYYTCRECCCQTKPGITMCYCEQCWQPGKHVGHNFRSVVSSGGSAYCDCGRQARIKPQSFCCLHADKTQRNLEYSEEQKNKIIDFYQSLIMCYVYLKTNQAPNKPEKQLEAILNKQMEQLCSGSLYYIRIFLQILRKQIIIEDKAQTVLQYFLYANRTSEKVLFALMGDNQFLYFIVTIIRKIKLTGWTHEGFRLVVSQLYETDDILVSLGKNGQFVMESTQKYLQFAKRSKIGVDLLLTLIKKHQESKNYNEWIVFITKMFTQNQIKFLNNNKNITKLLLSSFLTKLEQKQQPEQKKIQLITLISMCLYCLKDEEHTEITEISLQPFLYFCGQNIKKFLTQSSNTQQFWIGFLFSFIIKSARKDEYLSCIWKKITQQEENIRKDVIISIECIYTLTAAIIHSQVHLKSLFGQSEKQKDQAQKQSWMKSFLFQNREITRVQLLKVREKGVFNFPNSGEVLKKYCRYNDSKQTFKYFSEERFPCYAMKFKPERRNRSIINIPALSFRYSDEIKRKQISQECLEVLYQIFNSPSFVEQFIKKWYIKREQIQHSIQKRNTWISSNIGFYFVMTLIYGNALSLNKNAELKKQIEKIRGDEQILNDLYGLCDQKDRIDQILQITKGVSSQECLSSEKKKQEEEQNNSNQKQKKLLSELKKQKLLKKFQQANEKILAQNIIEQPQQTEQCIVCREGRSQSNPLVYLGYYDKMTSPSFILHGADFKSQVGISSCLHIIHFDCFNKIMKNGFQFECPYCKKRSNIYLPRQIEDRKTGRRFSNLINAIEVTKNKNHDFRSLGGVLFKHLVGSCGLNRIVLPLSSSDLDRIKKLDKVMLDMLKDCMKKAVETEKQDIFQQIRELQNQIYTCGKENLKLIQVIILQALRVSIFSQDRQAQIKSILEEMSAKLYWVDFQNVKMNIQQLLQKVFDVQIKEKNQNQKNSVGLRKVYPPNTTEQADQLKANKLCCLCLESEPRYLCLLCSQIVCHSCLTKDDHMKSHSLNIFSLDFTNKKITIRQTNAQNNGSHNIYFDNFMSPFEDRAKYKSQQIYELHRPRMDKLLMSYFYKS